MKSNLLCWLAPGLAVLLVFNPRFWNCFAQGTAFTYQDRLNDGGTPASGNYDMQFYARAWQRLKKRFSVAPQNL
jgi:hypothetical protein